MSLCEPASKLLGTSAGQFINIAIYCQSTLYLLNVHVDMSYLNILLKYRYIVSINYRMHITIIECIFCTCISSIRGQVFGVKTYSCVSLFYVCHCTNPTHYRYIGNMEFTIIDVQDCNIVPALLVTLWPWQKLHDFCSTTVRHIHTTPTVHPCHTYSTPVPHLQYICATPTVYPCHTFSTSMPHIQYIRATTPTVHPCHTCSTPCHTYNTSVPHVQYIHATPTVLLATPTIHLCHTYSSSMPHLQYVHSHSSKSGAYWIDHPLAIVRNFKFILSPFTNIASVI